MERVGNLVDVRVLAEPDFAFESVADDSYAQEPFELSKVAHLVVFKVPCSEGFVHVCI